MATLRATLLDFHFAYKHAPRGYAHLQLELRAWVCGAWAVEVVVGSGGGATAKLLCVDRGLSETVRSTLDLVCEVFDASLYIKSIVPATNNTRKPCFMHRLHTFTP